MSPSEPARLLSRLAPPRHDLLTVVVAAAAEAGLPIYLVGGAVRDLLLGELPADLDVVVEGDALALARSVAAARSFFLRLHTRFRTAVLEAPGGHRLDLASARAERYPRAGALPGVREARLAADLRRRDFTINAMALPLTPAGPGRLVDPLGGRHDLDAGLVRVLHPLSFSDDPSRAFRAVRYAARLGFRLESQTREWLAESVARGAVRQLSPARLGAEISRLAAEEHLARGLEQLRRLELLAAVHPCLDRAPLGAAARRLERFLAGRSRESRIIGLLALLVCRCSTDEASAALGRLQGARGARRGVLLAMEASRTILAALPPGGDLPDDLLWSLCHRAPDEGIILAEAAAADAGQRRALARYRRRLAGMTLAIFPRDLLAAGVPPGPEISLRLSATMQARLSGRLRGRRAELAYALSPAALESPRPREPPDRRPTETGD
jgi:tRNA nucleotidyltransferase (CCA-adding enzyme)